MSSSLTFHYTIFSISRQTGQRGSARSEHDRGRAAVPAPGRGAVPALGPGPGQHRGQRAQREPRHLGRGDPDIRVQHSAILQPVTGADIIDENILGAK